jgi:hypothetical protein
MNVAVDYSPTSVKSHQRFKRDKPHLKHYDITKYRSVIYAINEALAKRVLENEIVKLPNRCGYLFPYKYKKSRDTKVINGKTVITLPINWKETKAQGRKIYHMNYHSDGYIYKIMWRRNRTTKLRCWSFDSSRLLSRTLAQKVLAHELQ